MKGPGPKLESGWTTESAPCGNYQPTASYAYGTTPGPGDASGTPSDHHWSLKHFGSPSFEYG